MGYNKHLEISFGAYVQAYNENQPANNMEERTIDGILLQTLDNMQGGYEVLNLQTGKPVKRHSVRELPITPTMGSAFASRISSAKTATISAYCSLFSAYPSPAVPKI